MLVAFLLASADPVVLAAPPPCTQDQATRAEDEAGRLSSWSAVHRWYRLYAACNDVSAEEEYSESIARLLVAHWNSLPQLLGICKKDPKFRSTVLGGINATLDMNDIKKIKERSQSQCPGGARSLCREMILSADQALAEDATYRK